MVVGIFFDRTMRITVKTGLIAASAWIFIKLIAFYSGSMQQNVVPMVMLNILGVLLSVAIGLFLHKRQEGSESNLLSDIKNGLSAGVPYVLVVSIFLYVYYDRIDPEFNAHQIAEFQAGLEKELNDPVQFQKLKDSNPEFEVKTKEEIFDSVMQGPLSFYRPGSTMAISMLALLLLATLNSIFVSIVYRRFIFRRN
jgi:hypothetical protein